MISGARRVSTMTHQMSLQGNRFGDVFQLVSEEHGLHAAIQAFDRRIVKVPHCSVDYHVDCPLCSR